MKRTRNNARFMDVLDKERLASSGHRKVQDIGSSKKMMKPAIKRPKPNTRVIHVYRKS